MDDGVGRRFRRRRRSRSWPGRRSSRRPPSVHRCVGPAGLPSRPRAPSGCSLPDFARHRRSTSSRRSARARGKSAPGRAGSIRLARCRRRSTSSALNNGSMRKGVDAAVDLVESRARSVVASLIFDDGRNAAVFPDDPAVASRAIDARRQDRGRRVRRSVPLHERVQGRRRQERNVARQQHQRAGGARQGRFRLEQRVSRAELRLLQCKEKARPLVQGRLERVWPSDQQ